jgi:urease accessory protein UreH
MDGLLELVAERNAEGATYLAHRYATPPFCISKPHDHGTHLQVQLQQVGPGLLGGDQVSVKVEVKNGRLMVTSPSALRLLPKGGRASALGQTMTVADGASLAVWPEPVFPHRGGACRQKNELRLERNASLFWFDALAPGRDVSGERHVWEHLDIETLLRRDDELLLWERLSGSGGQWKEISSFFGPEFGWTGIFHACTPEESFAEDLHSMLDSTPPRDVQWGISVPETGFASLKFAAADGQGIRNMRAALMAAVEIYWRQHA